MKILFSNIFKNNYLIFFVFVFLTFLNLISKVESEPIIIEKLNTLHNALSKISNQEVNSDSFKFFLKIIKKTYDSEKMSKMILGKNWVKLNEAKKKRFIDVFEKYMTVNYLRQFSKITKLKFENKKTEKIGEKFRLSQVNLIFGAEEKIKLNYLLHNKNEKWRIFDVLIDGSISKIATKKSEFNQIIKDKGIDQLISILDQRSKV